MELVKHTPEEQAKIDHDKSRPHAVVVVCAPLIPENIFQTGVADMIERATVEVKERADAARMIVLSTALSTNMMALDGILYLSVMLLCQWAEIEKLEEQQRRAFLAAGGTNHPPQPRRGA